MKKLLISAFAFVMACGGKAVIDSKSGTGGSGGASRSSSSGSSSSGSSSGSSGSSQCARSAPVCSELCGNGQDCQTTIATMKPTNSEFACACDSGENCDGWSG